MIAFVPESGGDLGMEVIRWLSENRPDIYVIALDAAPEGPEGVIMGVNGVRVRVPLASDPDCIPAIMGLMSQSPPGDVYVMPTGEFMPEVFYRLIDDKWDFRHLQPPRGSWMISRNKRHLYQEFGSIRDFSDEWREDLRFRKPIDGVGGRGCELCLEPVPVDPNFIFQRELVGPEYVVDVLFGKAMTRRVDRMKGSTDSDMMFVNMPKLQAVALSIASDLKAPVLNAQFMMDELGRAVLTDVGTRLSASALCAELAGVNFMTSLLRGGWSDDFNPDYGARVRRVWHNVRY